MHRASRAFSLVGLLVTMVIMVVLASVLLTSLNQAVTGAGNTKEGTVRSIRDEMNLKSLFQSIMAWSADHGGGYILPSEIDHSHDPTINTTANFYSVMIAQHYTVPKNLISENERNPYVEEDWDYNFGAANAAAKRFWDPNFKADLERGSNVSYGHLPMAGRRAEANWVSPGMNPNFPLLGSRGPKDGVANPQSYTYGRDGTWGGYFVFGDGHVAFANTFTLPTGDNVFAMERGATGDDAVIAFTKSLGKSGVELQFD
jgi:hypothetical protein